MRLMLQGVVLLVAVVATASATEKSLDPIHVPPGERGGCNLQGDPHLCIPLDGTWNVVTFSQAACAGPVNPADPCQQNDDDFSFLVPLGFVFDFYGTPQTDVYINNNGNLSFGGGYCTFTASGFPIADFPMIAPFWGDVDTRSVADGAGVVYMKQGPNYLAVTWDHVGYYFTHSDLRNTFQVIISDGSFEPIGLGNNVCFCYGDMQWTTGDASGGVGGFGGTPATVGANKGDGSNYFQIGRFDHPGNDYDGPDGAADGVDFLDFQEICFAAGNPDNQPPIGVDLPSGCVNGSVGDVINLTVHYIPPEGNQTVSVVVADGGLANFTANVTSGNPATVAMTFSPMSGQEGNHAIVLTATDNYNPPGMTVNTIEFCIGGGTPTEGKSWGQIKARFRTDDRVGKKIEK